MALTTAQIQQAYVTFFSRPADPVGLAYWQAYTGSVADLYATFAQQTEYSAAFSGLTSAQKVNVVYQNLFGRDAEATGLLYWAGKVESGAITVANLALAVSAGSQGTDLVTVNSRVSAATSFSAALDTPAEILGYTGATANAAAKTWLAGVTTAANLATAVAAIDTATAAVVAVGGAAGSTFTLTIGADNFPGTAGNDSFVANETTAVTWTVGDVVDGGAGNDTLTVTQTAAITVPTGVTVKNIETVNLVSGTTATSVNSSAWTGIKALNITAPGAVTATGNATTALSVTDATLGTAAVTLDGGSTVSATTTSAGTGSTIAIGGTTAAAGAVTVNATTTMADGAGATTATGTAVTVTGGTAVTVNATLTPTGGSNNAGDTLTGGAITVTGDASTTAVTVNQTAAAARSTTGAGTAAIVDGQVVIADKNAASTTAASTITTVSIGSFGDGGGATVSTVNSGALTTINLSGNGLGAGLTVTNGSLTTPTVTTQSLNLNGFSTGAGAGVITLDSDITTLNITSSVAANTIKSLVAGGATTVNISGDKDLTLTGQTIGAATAVNVTSTGKTTLGTALGTGVLFTGGAGADVITLADETTKAITLGAGDDKVTIVDTDADGVLNGTGGSVAAGDGEDTIVLTAVTADAVDANSTFNTKFTGFEVLDITTGTAADTTVNLAGINGVSKVVTRGVATTKTLTLDGFANGGTLTLDAAAAVDAAVAANVTNAVLQSANTFNVALKNSTNATVEYGIVKLAGIETVNINLSDVGTTTSTVATVDTATLQATSATSIVVTGNNGLTLVNTGNTAVTSFDATGVVGDAAEDTAALLAVTFTGANTTTTAAVTIKGGAGNDVLTGSASKDTITGGAGGDIVNGGLGQDTINVGTGHDVIKIISDIDTTAGNKGVQSTTAAPDAVNGFVLASAITTAVDLSDAAKFIAASTAGGANTSMLSIDLNKDDGAGTAGTNVVVSIEADQATATAAQAAGTTYTVSKGILSLAGTGAPAVDTLAEWLVEAAAVSATDGETIAFVYGGDTYVFSQNGTGDSLVQLVGVAATSLVLASNATTVTAGAVIVGDSL